MMKVALVSRTKAMILSGVDLPASFAPIRVRSLLLTPGFLPTACKPSWRFLGDVIALKKEPGPSGPGSLMRNHGVKRLHPPETDFVPR